MKLNYSLFIIILWQLNFTGCSKIMEVRHKIRSIFFSSTNPAHSQSSGTNTSDNIQVAASSENIEQQTMKVVNDPWVQSFELCRSYTNDPSDKDVKEQLLNVLNKSFQGISKIKVSEHQTDLESCINNLAQNATESLPGVLDVYKVIWTNSSAEQKKLLIKTINEIWSYEPKYFFEQFAPIIEDSKCFWILNLDNQENLDGEIKQEIYKQKIIQLTNIQDHTSSENQLSAKAKELIVQCINTLNFAAEKVPEN